jgi:hypothetical protein
MYLAGIRGRETPLRLSSDSRRRDWGRARGWARRCTNSTHEHYGIALECCGPQSPFWAELWGEYGWGWVGEGGEGAIGRVREVRAVAGDDRRRAGGGGEGGIGGFGRRRRPSEKYMDTSIPGIGWGSGSRVEAPGFGLCARPSLRL